MTKSLLTTLQTLATFTLIWVMTGGGLGRKSSTLPSTAQPKKAPSRLFAGLALGFVGLSFVIPLVWLVLSSVNPQVSVSLSVPESLTTGNYTAVFNMDQTFRPLWNSAILSLGTVLLTVIAGALAAYPLSRYKMRFTRGLMYTILFGTCLPITAMMVPVYSLFVRLSLLDPMKQPAAVAIYNFFRMYGTIGHGELAAFLILYSTPVLVLHAVMRKVFDNCPGGCREGMSRSPAVVPPSGGSRGRHSCRGMPACRLHPG